MEEENSSDMETAVEYIARDTENRTKCAFPGCGGTPGHEKTYCPACKHKTRPKDSY